MSNLITTDRAAEVVLIASAGQTVFSYPFVAFQSSDLAVTSNSVTIETLAVTGLRSETGGTLTVAPQPAGARIVIRRNVPVRRSIDLPTSGPYNSDDIDAEFDRAFAILQEHRTDFSRALLVPAGESLITLPPLASRANKVLSFDSSGNLLPVDTAVFAGPPGPTGSGTAVATTRTALAGITSPPNNESRFLMEAGREGLFKFSTANLSASVTADPAQSVYVAPTAATTGASGAWVRQNFGTGGHLTPEQFGAVGNCTAVGVGTDDGPAFQAMLNLAALMGEGYGIKLSNKKYRSAQRLVIHDGVKIEGIGHFENAGIYTNELGAVVTTTSLGSMDGSIIVFDDNVPGMILYAGNTVTSNAFDALGTNALKYIYRSAQRSVLKDFMLWGGGENGTNVLAHGLEIRTVARLNNVRISHFAGDGCRIEASGHSENIAYGLADIGTYAGLVCRANGMHALHVKGNDANVMSFVGGDFAICGGACVLDESQLGNSYISCHSSTGNQTHAAAGVTGFTKTGAAYVAKRDQLLADDSRLGTVAAGAFMTTSAVGAHTFVGCYAEGGPTAPGSLSYILTPAVVMGGNIASNNATTGGISPSATCTIYGYNRIDNVENIRPSNAGSLTFEASGLVHKPLTGSAVLTVDSPGSYATYQMKAQGSLANGLDILTGFGACYLSSDTFVLRNAAQSVTFATFDSGGITLPTGKAVKVNGTQVVGARQTGTAANATDLATALTLVNDLKAKLVAHGLIS